MTTATLSAYQQAIIDAIKTGDKFLIHWPKRFGKSQFTRDIEKLWEAQRLLTVTEPMIKRTAYEQHILQFLTTVLYWRKHEQR